VKRRELFSDIAAAVAIGLALAFFALEYFS